jgi:hypothetical protein
MLVFLLEILLQYNKAPFVTLKIKFTQIRNYSKSLAT